MGSIVLNIVRGNQVQDHGGFCKEGQVCFCFGDFEEYPIPSQ